MYFRLIFSTIQSSQCQQVLKIKINNVKQRLTVHRREVIAKRKSDKKKTTRKIMYRQKDGQAGKKETTFFSFKSKW